MPADRRTIKNWAHRLSAEDEPLTMDETLLLATIAQTDRLLEIRDTLQDMQMRLNRLEVFVGSVVPAYDPTVRRALGEVANGTH